MNSLPKLIRRLVAFACITGSGHLLSFGVAQADDPPATRHTFVSKLSADLDLDILGTKQVTHAETRLRTSIDRGPAELRVVVHAVQVQAENNKEAVMDLFVDRRSWKDRLAKAEFTRENAPERILQQLGAFDTALCTVSVDQDGREQSRALSATVRQGDLLANQIDNILFFQSPYYFRQSEWQAQRQISISQGGVVTGELMYKKRGNTANGDYVVVDVSGELMNPSHRQPGSPVAMEDTKYVAQGEQTYNLAAKVWERGRIRFDISFVLATAGQRAGTANGTMSYIFEPAKVTEP